MILIDVTLLTFPFKWKRALFPLTVLSCCAWWSPLNGLPVCDNIMGCSNETAFCTLFLNAYISICDKRLIERVKLNIWISLNFNPLNALDVYISPKNMIQQPRTYIYILMNAFFYFTWLFKSFYCGRWKELFFPSFFLNTTTSERPGKRKIRFGKDVYIRPCLLSHNFCMYIPNICGRSANTSVVV